MDETFGYHQNRVMDETDSVLEINADGQVHAVGDTASLRLEGRRGRYHLLPSPPDVLLMQRQDALRTCLLCGALSAPGSLCEIISFIGQTGSHGELLVFDDDASRSIYFEAGHVVGARSTATSERLGQVLLRHGLLTDEEVGACVEAALDGSQRFGEAAVRFGFLSREKLFYTMQKHAEEIVFGALLVKSGSFYFLEGYDANQIVARQNLAVSTLVRDGVRRMHEMRFFRRRIPSILHVPTRSSGGETPEQDVLGIFPWINGLRSVEDLCRLTNKSEFEVSRLLFQLLQGGHIVMKPPRLSAKAAVDIYNDAITTILRELDAIEQGDSVRTQLSQFVHQRAIVRKLLEGAGGNDDGSLNAATITHNLATVEAGADPEEFLARVLHELASYAMFLARPHLDRRRNEPQSGRPHQELRLSDRVRTILEPIAPAELLQAESRGEEKG